MSQIERLAFFLIGLAAVVALLAIADCLCEMTPTVTVQVIPTPESSGDKAATAGSE